mmetsp:Transcript_31626/g.107255  ORF Transcript_31626/g.107255 Transcript_31626/m.107255 type:complete len:312 (+) Transcript_31626:396-1331(+)
MDDLPVPLEEEDRPRAVQRRRRQHVHVDEEGLEPGRGEHLEHDALRAELPRELGAPRVQQQPELEALALQQRQARLEEAAQAQVVQKAVQQLVGPAGVEGRAAQAVRGDVVHALAVADVGPRARDGQAHVAQHAPEGLELRLRHVAPGRRRRVLPKPRRPLVRRRGAAPEPPQRRPRDVDVDGARVPARAALLHELREGLDGRVARRLGLVQIQALGDRAAARVRHQPAVGRVLRVAHGARRVQKVDGGVLERGPQGPPPLVREAQPEARARDASGRGHGAEPQRPLPELAPAAVPLELGPPPAADDAAEG